MIDLALDGGTAVVNVVANGAGLAKSIAAATQQGVTQASTGIATAGSKITSALMNPLVQVGALAVGVVAKLGFEFEDAFQRISAISNASTADIAKWREEVLSLAGETAQSPKELADALFFLSSAGLEAGQVMEALNAAAKGSAVGLGDTADVANIVASALNAYAESGLTAASVTDTLVAAVREGRAEPEEFATALGRILPIASEAGVSFDQVAASMAGLSNIGLDVNEGVTAMRGALQAIVAPGAQAANAMKDLDLSAQDLLDAIQQDGLIGALALLKQRALENSTGQADYLGILRKVIPNVRALTGVLGLSGDAAAKNAVIFDRVADSAGSLNKAFDTTERSPAFQMRKAMNDLVVVGTQLGIVVLPVLVSVLKVIAEVLKPVGEAIGPLVDDFKDIGAAMGPLFEGSTAASGGLLSVSKVAKTLLVDLNPLVVMVRATASALRFLGLVPKSVEAIATGTHVWTEEEKALLGPLFDAVHATDELTTHVDKAGKAVRNFAGLTKPALKEFRSNLVTSVQVAIGQFKNMGEAFTLSTQQLQNQARAAVRIARQEQRDLAAIFGSKELSEKQKTALASLSADQRHAFAEGGKAARAQIAADAVKLQAINLRTINQITRATTTKATSGGHETGVALDAGLVKGIIEGSPAVSAAAAKVVADAIAAARAAAQAESPSKKTQKLGHDLIDGLVKGMNERIGKVSRTLEAIIPLMQKALGAGAADQARAFLRDLDALDKRFTKLKDKIGGFRTAIRGAFGDFGDLLGGVAAALEQFRQDQEQFLVDQAAFAAQGEGGTLTAPVAPTSPDIQALVSSQVAQAQQLAKLLKQLQGAGLSTPLLAQLAGQGAGGIATAEALLADPALIQAMNDAQQQIADITQATADKLTQVAFGDKVARMGEQLDQLLVKLREFLQGLNVPELKDETREFINQLRRLNEALGGVGGGGGAPAGPGGNSNITINVNAGPGTDGQQVGRDIRDALLVLQRRNGTTGL